MAASKGSQMLIRMKMAERGGAISVVICGIDERKDMYLVLSLHQYRLVDFETRSLTYVKRGQHQRQW